jgi:hypothetical protein
MDCRLVQHFFSWNRICAGEPWPLKYSTTHSSARLVQRCRAALLNALRPSMRAQGEGGHWAHVGGLHWRRRRGGHRHVRFVPALRPQLGRGRLESCSMPVCQLHWCGSQCLGPDSPTPIPKPRCKVHPAVASAGATWHTGRATPNLKTELPMLALMLPRKAAPSTLRPRRWCWDCNQALPSRRWRPTTSLWGCSWRYDFYFDGIVI